MPHDAVDAEVTRALIALCIPFIIFGVIALAWMVLGIKHWR